jgi:hypothetical protein
MIAFFLRQIFELADKTGQGQSIGGSNTKKETHREFLVPQTRLDLFCPL